MLILVGESASGKSTIEKYLVDHYDYKKIVSYTTRSPREGESDGVDYHFISNEEFLKLKSEGFFAETGCYNGWYYGSSKADCTDDKIAVLTPHGMRQLRKNLDLKLFVVYIKVPRRERLIKILQRGDNIEESYRRNLSDVGQFDGIEDEVNHIIKNNNYESSVKDLAFNVDFYYKDYLKWR